MELPEQFRELGISEHILRALAAKGFVEPSPIQKQTIPLLLSGEKDVIGQAQTGTGKTAAFGIPILESIKPGESRNPRALILTPTRELCIQVADELNSIEGDNGLKIAPFYGGQYIGIQLGLLRSGIDVIVGTPGRVIDLIERGRLVLDEVQFMVLDEADEMLDMGFIEDIEKILSAIPEEKRMLMFSATMPKEIQEIAVKYMRPGYEIVRTAPAVCDTLTKQIYYEIPRESKLDVLTRLIDLEGDMYAMVFCRTREDVDDLAEALIAKGITVDAIHGDIVQAQRTRVISNFKAGKFKILIATDVAARGIDVNNLSHVINYSVPESVEPYIHRVGRTGRAGKTGIAITFVTPGERRRFAMIRKKVAVPIEKGTLPKGTDVADAKKARLVETLQTLAESGDCACYYGFAAELMRIAHPAGIIAALLKLHYASTLDPEAYEELARPEPQRERGNRRDKYDGEQREQGRASDFVRLEFSAGKADGFSVPELLELIHHRAGIRSVELGRIECGSDITIVNTTKTLAEKIMASMEPGDPEVRECAAGPRKQGRGGNRRGNDRRSIDGGFRRERRREAYQERRERSPRYEDDGSAPERRRDDFKERRSFRRDERPSRREEDGKKPFWEKFRKRRPPRES
ncbi:MAG: DEAD/DEAH box helicase [Lentisphaerae bacterium]|nr:DEAD/DEAH box helicase [Lentisphaerota bacterium]